MCVPPSTTYSPAADERSCSVWVWVRVTGFRSLPRGRILAVRSTFYARTPSDTRLPTDTNARAMITTPGNLSPHTLPSCNRPPRGRGGKWQGAHSAPRTIHGGLSGPVFDLDSAPFSPSTPPNQLPPTPAVTPRTSPAVGSRSAVCGPVPSLNFTLYLTVLGTAESSSAQRPPWMVRIRWRLSWH